MKISGKLLSAALASVLVFSLAGCGDKENQRPLTQTWRGQKFQLLTPIKVTKSLSRRLKVKSAMPL